MKKRRCAGVKQHFLNNKSSYQEQLDRGTCLIIGIENTIARKLTLELATFSSSFILVSSDMTKANATSEKVKAIGTSNGRKIDCTTIYSDLGSLRMVSSLCDSVRENLASSELPLSLIVFCVDEKPSKNIRKITWEGFEKTFQVNMLSPAFIYLYLEDLLNKPEYETKLIFSTSPSALNGPFTLDTITDHGDLMRKVAKPQYVEIYNPTEYYSTAKLLLSAFAKVIHHCGSNHYITACSVPIKQIGKISSKFGKAIDKAAASLLYTCLCPFEKVQGLIFNKFQFIELPDIATDLSIFKQFIKNLFRNYRKFEADIEKKRKLLRLQVPKINPFLNMFDNLHPEVEEEADEEIFGFSSKDIFDELQKDLENDSDDLSSSS